MNGTRLGDYKYCCRHHCNHLRSAFAANVLATDGLQGWCKEAMREYRARKKLKRKLMGEMA